ncbi:MAG: hypothetical protein M3R51_00540 [Candidatus Eremiobacteraeota bacterium]|nr:hypothetical protein [Candidatus Eremiobacteraeota bacterium]
MTGAFCATPHRSGAALLWLAALLVAIGGYALIVAPEGHLVGDVMEHSRMLYDEANIDDRKIARGATLAGIQSRVKGDIRRLGGETSAGASTALALRRLEVEAAEEHAEIRSVTPDQNAAPMSTHKAADPLIGTQWDFVVRAHFREIVALLSSVSRHDALLDVRDVELVTVGAKTQTAPLLDATVHAMLYRPRSPEDIRVDSASR